MPVDLDARRGHTLRRSYRKSSVTHLAGLVSISVARLLRLTLDCHTVFQRLQHATWPTNDFHFRLHTARDFDVSFTRDSGRHFDESNLVTLDDINALLCLWFLATRRSRRNTAGNARPRGCCRRRLLDDCFERHGQHVLLRISGDGRG